MDCAGRRDPAERRPGRTTDEHAYRRARCRLLWEHGLMATATVDRPASLPLSPAGITTWLWRSGERPAQVDLAEASLGEYILQFDVESGADPLSVYRALSPICGDDL